jgi:hypothetical protein
VSNQDHECSMREPSTGPRRQKRRKSRRVGRLCQDGLGGVGDSCVAGFRGDCRASLFWPTSRSIGSELCTDGLSIWRQGYCSRRRQLPSFPWGAIHGTLHRHRPLAERISHQHGRDHQRRNRPAAASTFHGRLVRVRGHGGELCWLVCVLHSGRVPFQRLDQDCGPRPGGALVLYASGGASLPLFRVVLG